MKLPEIKELTMYTDQIYDLCYMRGRRKRLKILNQLVILLGDGELDKDVLDKWISEVMGKSKYWKKREKLEGEI